MDTSEPKPKRRWTRFLVPRFRLRTLMILVTVIAVVLGYLFHQAREQERVVAWVEKHGGRVGYEYYRDDVLTPEEYYYGREPGLLRDFLGDDFFYDVETVDLAGREVSNLSPLASLTNLKFLYLNESAVSDLSPVDSLTNLVRLDLNGTDASDLSLLASLTNLKFLYLNETAVSNLSPLASLTNLEFLGLDGAAVSNLSPLVSLTNLRELDLDGTVVSDLSPLNSLTNLEVLFVRQTRVTKEEITKLQATLPNCVIFHDFE